MGLSCRELIHEEKASAIRYRNTFGTQRVGGFIANAFDLYLKNPANTNVVEWGKRLLALWEVGYIPYVSVFVIVWRDSSLIARHARVKPHPH